MNDEQQPETMIDQALQTYPQVTLPPGFVNRVMIQVEVLPHRQPEQFQLHFLDIILTLFIGGITTALLLGIFATFGIVTWGWLPTDALSSFSLDSLSASARFWLILGIVLLTEILLGAGVCIQLWQDRPYSVTYEY